MNRAESLEVPDRLVGSQIASRCGAADGNGGGGPPGLEPWRVLSIEIPSSPEATTLARRALDDFDEVLDGGLRYELQLLVTELVTNSLRHGRLAPRSSIGLAVSVAARRTRVEVSDLGCGFATSNPEIDREKEEERVPEPRGSG